MKLKMLIKKLIKLSFIISYLIPSIVSGQLSVSTDISKSNFQAFESEMINFVISGAEDSLCKTKNFRIIQGKVAGMEIDSLGQFSWIPPYHMVDRIENEKFFQILVTKSCNQSDVKNYSFDLKVFHKNRPPVVGELPVFFIQYNTNNNYTISPDIVHDDDNDPIVFIPILETFPEGLNLNSKGEISWSPSLIQFKSLKTNPFFVEFMVQDQPSKTFTKGKIKIEATQQDLPPIITIVPKKEYFQIRENENVNVRFYLTDPNGEEDIMEFDFLTNKPNFPKSTLIKNTNNQYEFIWMPGYDFVQDPHDTLGFYIDFYVIDKSQKREVKRLNFNVKNTVNEAELDLKNYGLYYGTLTRAWELLEQLKEKEEELKKAYNKARKGKKHRSVLNASLGATTGLSSIFAKDKPDTQRLISTVGGTTVLTIGTLEATEVIGKSMKDLIDRLNYVIEKKNEIQTKGDIFSRDYSLKSSRRSQDYLKKVDDFMSAMSLKGLVALELNATWESKQKPSEEKIKKTFKDFIAW
ncbi:MAG: hypothetical protein IPH28_19425 [Cytophagaceae bacterium]|nr:hypothetical protein [Cytophagaceae bacterium]